MPASLRSDVPCHPQVTPAAIPWNGWPRWRGIGGRDGVEWVAVMAWNGWPRCVEYAQPEDDSSPPSFRRLRAILDIQVAILGWEVSGQVVHAYDAVET